MTSKAITELALHKWWVKPASCLFSQLQSQWSCRLIVFFFFPKVVNCITPIYFATVTGSHSFQCPQVTFVLSIVFLHAEYGSFTSNLCLHFLGPIGYSTIAGLLITILFFWKVLISKACLIFVWLKLWFDQKRLAINAVS